MPVLEMRIAGIYLVEYKLFSFFISITQRAYRYFRSLTFVYLIND